MASELDEVLKKLETLEDRINNIENNSQVVSEDRIEVEEKGRLGSEVVENRNDSVITTKRVPVCDFCGKEIKSFSICQKCEKKLCDKCSIEFRNQIICKQELQSIFPLSRQAFKVLLLVANNISDENNMNRLSGIPKKDLKEILGYLKGAGYMEFSAFFTRKSLTEMGKEALSSYGQILGGIGDMAQLDKEIARYMLGKP